MGRAAKAAVLLSFLACDGAKADPAPPAVPMAAEEAATSVVQDEVQTASVTAEAPAPDPHRYVSVSIRSSLEASIVEATDRRLGPKLTQVAKRVLVWWIDPRRDLRKGDRLELVYEDRSPEEPIVHAVWFHSLKLGRNKAAVRHQPEGHPFARFYHPDGTEVERRLVPSPIGAYEQVTSLINDGRRHRGVDFKAPVGTAIRAPFSGRVIRRNWARRRNGNCLEIQTNKGLTAYFLHLSSIEKSVRPGTRIKKGQLLARSGNTGRSSAPHLHYQLERNGRVVDPFRIHRTERKRLSSAQVEKVQAAFSRLAAYRTGSS